MAGLLDDYDLAQDEEFNKKVQVAVIRHAQKVMGSAPKAEPGPDAKPEELAAYQTFMLQRVFVQRVLDNTTHWAAAMARMLAADPKITKKASDSDIIDAVERHWGAFSA